MIHKDTRAWYEICEDGFYKRVYNTEQVTRRAYLWLARELTLPTGYSTVTNQQTNGQS